MRNSSYEQALDKQGVTWIYQDVVTISDIDRDRGLRNQARLEGPLDEELVEQYRELDRSGSEAPAVVLWRPGRGRFVPIDGNNRLDAKAKNGKTVTDAYIVQHNDPQIIDRLTWTWNNLVNGKRLSQEECLQHAITFVRKYSMSIQEAAKQWGVSKWKVQNAIQVQDVKDILNKNNVRINKSLTDHRILKVIGVRACGEDLLVKACEAISSAYVTDEEILRLAQDVRAKSTHEAKLKVIESFTASERFKTAKAASKGGTIQPPRPTEADQLMRAVRQVNRILDRNPDKKSLQHSGTEFKRDREEVKDMLDRMIGVFGLGATLEAGTSAREAG